MRVMALQRSESSGRSPETSIVFARIGRSESRGRLRRISRNEENSMMDILMLALGFVFFALAIGYTYACERL
jgi:hypothetical protein